jgi:hypothetical protein
MPTASTALESIVVVSLKASTSSRSVEHRDQRRAFILAGLVRCISSFDGAGELVRT